MTRTKSPRALTLLATACCFLTVTLAFQKEAYSHGPALELTHFPRVSRSVWIGLVPSHQRPSERLGAFEVGKGLSLVATFKQPAVVALPGAGKSDAGKSGSIEAPNGFVTWNAGEILAFVEGNITTAKPALAKQGNKGFYFLSAQEYLTLVKDSYLYIHAISQTNETVLSERNALVSQTTARDTHARAAEVLQQTAPDFIEISRTHLLQAVRKLSGLDPVTVSGKPLFIKERKSADMRAATRTWMKETYQALGLVAEEKCYNQRNYQGCNLEATLVGEDPSRFVIVTSHLDTVGTPGADDNGSGTAAVLEIARALSTQKPGIGIKFVSFDQEELGLIGSKAYVASLLEADLKSIEGVVNMDMIGFDSDNDGAIHIMDCGRKDSTGLAAVTENVAQAMNLPLKKVAACTNRSDHASFWARGIGAVIVSENFFGNDANPCYHKSCDTLDRINLDYFERITTLVANTVWTMSKAQRH